MKLTSQISLAVTALLIISISACGGGGTESGDLSSTDPDSLDEIVSQSPLYVTLSSKYDTAAGTQDGDETYHGVCNIDPDNLAANDIACEIKIPEGQLHYSELNFTYGTGNSSMCPYVEIFPYYRQLSNSAAYTPFGATAPIDCSAANTQVAACYDGAAKDFVGTDFPKYTGIWFTTANSLTQTTAVNSSWDAETYGNTHVCNNLSAAGRLADVTPGGGIPQQYEASGVYTDYHLYCRDQFHGILFHIKMTITDEDLDASDTFPADDEFYDWN